MSETEVQTNEGTAQPTAVEQHKQEFLEHLRKYIIEYGDESNLVIVMAQTSKGNKTMEFDEDSVELTPALEIINNLGDSFREESVKLAERSAVAAEQIRKYPSMVKNKGEPQPKNVDSIRTPSGIVEATNLNFMKCKYCESVRCTLIKTTINANPGDSLIVPHVHINIFYRCCGCHKDFVVRMMLGIPEYFDKLFYGDLSNGFACEHPSGKEDYVMNRWEGLRNYIQWYKEREGDFDRDFLIFSVKKKGDGTIEIEEDDE